MQYHALIFMFQRQTDALNDTYLYTRAPTPVYPVCGDLIVVLDRNRNKSI